MAPPELALRLAPVLAAFAAGVAGRRLGWFAPRHADALLRLMVRAGLPALILGTVPALDLAHGAALLPLVAAAAILAGWPAGLALARGFRLPRPAAGVVVTGLMILNLAAVYPFAWAAWGAEGAGRLALFDFGNGLLVLTLVYALACAYGSGRPLAARILRALATFPPTLALALALALNLAGLAPPGPAAAALRALGGASVLLVVLALGVHFRAPGRHLGIVAAVVAARLGVGLATGLGAALLLGLEGVDRGVVLLGAAAPVGFNTLVFAAAQDLDRELAAGLVSVSLLAGLVYLPLLILAA
ncbi:hypothetical protein [Inmirania thermothiophila]|uniref:AEC family transporter n=1 Tax=Inmirania thermothiophila TaxID=1750597 RepID=A0A3N1Y256_9GAMM|nr:hypothetical protein [Inmirania thermothiophila]ROR32899.1 hypothetical protein EDC57_2114 [Inmirania thermothiophila]